MSKAPVQPSLVDNYNWKGYLENLLKKKGQGRDSPDTFKPLYNAVRHRNWERVRSFVQSHPDSVTVQLTESAETVLHKVVESLDTVQLVEKIVALVTPQSLELTDVYGNTALSRAAAVGNVKAAEIMLRKNPNLLFIENNDGHSPLDHAARFGHKEAVCCLLSATLRSTNSKPISGANGSRLLMHLISSNLYGVAVNLLQHYPDILRDTSIFRKRAFEKLARKPRAFPSGNPDGFLSQLIYNCIPVVDENKHLLLAPKRNMSHPQTADADIESLHKSSEESLMKSSLFKSLQHITRVSGTMCSIVHVIFWSGLKNLVPSIKGIHDRKLMHMQVLELSRIMCHGVDWSDKEAYDILRTLMVVPSRLGNYELVEEAIKVYPASIMFLDDDGRNIFQRAVMFRNENVVNLLHEYVLVKQWVESFKDHHGNNKNILHLAGKLSPSLRVPGAALQMQRELQWFKAVENLVHPSLQEEESNYETPREYFTKQHKELVKAGEEWMKNTATSCSVVAALIVTVVFAAAFTSPGGNNNDGVPNFLNVPSFLIFAASDALALFSSITSVLMFLSMLTSRYSEDDFLESLPRKLIIGLIMLFFSIATMIIAFGAALHLLLVHKMKWIWVPTSLMAFVPVSLFAGLQIPLLVDMIHSTYFSRLLQPNKYGKINVQG